MEAGAPATPRVTEVVHRDWGVLRTYMGLAWSSVLLCLERRGVWGMELAALKPGWPQANPNSWAPKQG